MIEEIQMKTGHYSYKSWEIMAEGLAKWLVLNNKTGIPCAPTLKFAGLGLEKDAIYEHLEGLDLFRNYYEAAKAQPWDHIGEVFMEMELVGLGQNMTPRAIVELMTRMVHGTRLPVDGEAEFFCYESYRNYELWHYAERHFPPTHLEPMELPIHTQLDPCVGTGRFLIVASQMMPKANLVLFGIEINLSLYRACLVNMAMFSNHPYSIICADSLRLDQNKCGMTSKLWDLGNRWIMPDISAFYWKPPPIGPDRFSLKAFTALKEVEKNEADNSGETSTG